MYKIEFNNLPWESPMEGMRQKKQIISNKIIRLVEYSNKLPFHWCENGHIGYVIDGELDIQFDKEKQHYRPGDCIFIPNGNNHKHAGKVTTKTVKIFFVEET